MVASTVKYGRYGLVRDAGHNYSWGKKHGIQHQAMRRRRPGCGGGIVSRLRMAYVAW